MAISRISDVTNQIIDYQRIYGSSDSTNQRYTASSRRLNYANGASIQRPDVENVSNIPVILNYKDSVGLFGSENHFIKVNVNIQNPVSGNTVIGTYEQANTAAETVTADDEYTLPNKGNTIGQAYINRETDFTSVNTFEPAQILNDIIPNLTSSWFKVELQNLKTGNIYVDSWLDVRLYNRHFNEHPYDIMYIKYNEPFYVGFHARNTKELPYNVNVVIGEPGENPELNLPALLRLEDIDKELLATRQ